MEVNLKTDSFWDIEKPNSQLPKWFFGGKKKNGITLETPKVIGLTCKGISLGNKTIKSILFSTDMALIENNDTDAILAVYPFSPSPKIMKHLIYFSEKPVVCGIGGGLTKGKFALEMAIQAEDLGASAIIVNQPFKNKDIETIKKRVSLPLISSVSIIDFPFQSRIDAGTDLFHITGGKQTNSIIKKIKSVFPAMPLMATGGKSLSCLRQSIDSGADSIVLCPPTSGDLFRTYMDHYRFDSKI